MVKTKKSRITHRLVSVKRHTLGFRVDGKDCNRAATVKMAKQGKLNNIHVVGNHIQALPIRKQKLLDLPQVIMA